MNDNTESMRRAASAVVNLSVESDNPQSERARLAAEYGDNNVFDTKELQQKFEVIAFLAPFCCVREKATGKKGVVSFQHSPRFYFNFVSADD